MGKDMMKGLAVAVFLFVVLFMATECFASSSLYPELNLHDISKCLIGKTVADWYFARDDHKAISILDVNYDGDMAEAHVFVQVIDGRGNHGRKGRFRLYYEWTEDYWKLIDIKPLVFSPW